MGVKIVKDWYIEGEVYGNCNCAYGCPCQFEADPTYGDCRGFEVLRIDNGHFDGIDLSGLTIAMFYAWPGLISEGKGELQAVIEDKASPEQREALETVLHGRETEEAATPWLVNGNSATSNQWGYLIIDGANNATLVNNAASSNAVYDMEFAGDSMRFGFLTPTSFDRLVAAI